jgi:hypothetical protein
VNSPRYKAAAVRTQIVTTYPQMSQSQQTQRGKDPARTPYSRLQIYPDGHVAVLGTRFDVDFNHVSGHKGTLVASRLLCCVRYKSKLGGARTIGSI